MLTGHITPLKHVLQYKIYALRLAVIEANIRLLSVSGRCVTRVDLSYFTCLLLIYSYIADYKRKSSIHYRRRHCKLRGLNNKNGELYAGCPH